MNDLRVHHAMTSKVKTLGRNHSLLLAGELMRLGRFRHVPVVSDDGTLVGIVTHRDLAAAQNSVLAKLTAGEREDMQLSVPIQHLMSRDVKTVSRDTPVIEAAQLMLDHKFGCTPVVDDGNKLVGIVTEADLVAVAARALATESPTLIDTMMSRNLITLRRNERLQLASALMQLERIRHLPVVEDDGTFVGLVTHRDLLAAQSSSLLRAPALPCAAHVHDLMHDDVWTITPTTSATTAARTLLDHDYGCLPVVVAGKLVGLVTEADFVKYLVSRLSSQPSRSDGHLVPVNYYMTEPAQTIVEYADLQQAYDRMQRVNVSSLAVVDDKGLLTGVLSHSDLLNVSTGRRIHRRHCLLRLPTRHVSDVMTREVDTLRASDSVSEACQHMVENQIHRVIVVADKRPLGVFSTTDAMLAVRDLRIDVSLQDVMTRMVFTISATEPVSHGLALLERAGITGLVVTDNGWPVGLFSSKEALRAGQSSHNMAIEEAMTPEVLCMPATMLLYRAAEQAAALKVRRIVVLDNALVCGIVTGLDFARCLADATPKHAG